MKEVIIVKATKTNQIYGIFNIDNEKAADKYIIDVMLNNPEVFDNDNKLEKQIWTVR